MRQFYILSLLLLVVSLPFSLIGISIAQFLLLIHLLITRNFRDNWQRLIQNKPAIILAALFILHLLGLLYSSDLNYGWKDVRVKIPMLSIPVFMAFQPTFTNKEKGLLLGGFSLSVIVATISTFIGSEFFDLAKSEDGRGMSFFISHIRFGLMILFTIFILLHAIICKYFFRWRWIFGAFMLWSLFYLAKLGTLTSVVVLFILSVFSLFYFLKSNSKTVKFTGLGFGLITASALFYLGNVVNDYYGLRSDDIEITKTHSDGGEAYLFKEDVQQFENGNRVWAYIAENELANNWNKRSKLKFDGLDQKGQPMFSTVIRYLTSKGLTKDSVGVWQLKNNDIQAIEAGVTNYKLLDGPLLEDRIYETIWEVDAYFKSYNPSGNTLTQRFLFWEVAVKIIKENPIFGVGTGDVKQAFEAMYEAYYPDIPKAFRKRAHNQYLAFTVAFGVVGLLLYLIVLISPFFVQKPSGYLWWIFYLIMIICMLNEDTYERQVGATFISFFFAFFWVQNRKEQLNH